MCEVSGELEIDSPEYANIIARIEGYLHGLKEPEYPKLSCLQCGTRLFDSRAHYCSHKCRDLKYRVQGAG